MPVSKRRKPKKRSTPVGKSSAASSSSSPAPKSGFLPKKKLTRQQIIIYVVSIVMILSLAASYLIGNSGPTVAPTPTLSNAALDTPAPANQSTEEVVSTPTPEPTVANN